MNGGIQKMQKYKDRINQPDVRIPKSRRVKTNMMRELDGKQSDNYNLDTRKIDCSNLSSRQYRTH